MRVTIYKGPETLTLSLPLTERLVTLPTGATIPADMLDGATVRLGQARDIGVVACMDWLREREC